MEKATESGGIKTTGTSSKTLPSESNGETYEEYPGSPIFAKGVVPDFQDVPEEEKEMMVKNALYPDIESLIIQWSNDGTKTAGTLARRITKLLIEKTHVITG